MVVFGKYSRFILGRMAHHNGQSANLTAKFAIWVPFRYIKDGNHSYTSDWYLNNGQTCIEGKDALDDANIWTQIGRQHVFFCTENNLFFPWNWINTLMTGYFFRSIVNSWLLITFFLQVGECCTSVLSNEINSASIVWPKTPQKCKRNSVIICNSAAKTAGAIVIYLKMVLRAIRQLQLLQFLFAPNNRFYCGYRPS